jgi:hypothetical protein
VAEQEHGEPRLARPGERQEGVHVGEYSPMLSMKKRSPSDFPLAAQVQRVDRQPAGHQLLGGPRYPLWE